MSTKTKKKSTGVVAFLGAGPGDPQLVSVRGVELLRTADVVVVDRDASHAVAESYVPLTAEVVDASCGDDGRPLTPDSRLLTPAPTASIARSTTRTSGSCPS